MIELKRCSNPKCKNPVKPESEFYFDRTAADGLCSHCKECRKEYARRYQSKRKQYGRDKKLEQEYGFLPGEFEKISKLQDHKCLICGQVKELVSDHCYRTYRNRGLICNSCNMSLGWYENNSVQEYLNKPNWQFCLVWLNSRNQRDSKLRGKHGICLDDFEMMLKSQNEVCGICFKPCATGRNLAVDHDWQTLRVRGLLCIVCNTKLGWYDNNSVQEYLNHYSNNTTQSGQISDPCRNRRN